MNHSDICALVVGGYETHTGRVGEVEYSVHTLPDMTVISFRGTEASKLLSGSGWRDVIRDMRIMPWYDRRTGWAHAGFLKGARSVIDGPLRGFLFQCSKPLVLTGHSLGAAMSLLAAMMLAADGQVVREWVGFGCPRALIGQRELPFEATAYRNRGDIVTELIRPWMFGYRHPVPLVQLGMPAWPNWPDHDVGNYLEALAPEMVVNG